MVAQPRRSFLTPASVTATAKELAASGFVSDEHDFAPYRETLNTHFAEIEKALRNAGHLASLLHGFVKHSEAGYAYYIYDADRFRNSNDDRDGLRRPRKTRETGKRDDLPD